MLSKLYNYTRFFHKYTKKFFTSFAIKKRNFIMLINPINSINLNKKINNPYSTKQIVFKRSEDFFTPSLEILNGKMPPEDVFEAIESIKGKEPIASGYTSNIYKHQDKIIKVPKKSAISDDVFNSFNKNQNIKEFYALDKIQKISPDIAVKPYSLIKKNETICLIEEYIKGNHVDRYNLTSELTADLLKKFFALDTNCILNYDIQPGNILITDSKSTKLIDFGAFCVIDDYGHMIPSESVQGNFFLNEAPNLITQKPATRFTKTFLVDNYKDIKNLMDNPHITNFSNASNFEFRSLYSYLLNNNSIEGFDLYKNYLIQKSELYHDNMSKFLSSLSLEELQMYNYSDSQIERAKSRIQKAINYENMAKNILANPSDDIIKIELAKLQLRTTLNLQDSLGSKVKNPNKLKDTYEQLITLLKEGIENSNGEKKDYLSETLKNYENLFKDYLFESEQVKRPDNENLVKIFTNLKTKKDIPEIKDTKNSHTKIILASIVGVTAVSELIRFIKKKAQKAEIPKS